MATETKKKNEEQEEVRERAFSNQEGTAPAAALERLNESVDFWANAISQLEGETFSSVEEAVDKVVDLVLENVQLEAGSQEDVRELLHATFETDPELSTLLKEALKL